MPFVNPKENRSAANLRVKIDSEVFADFKLYAQFLDSVNGDQHYAAQEILRKVMRYDREFQEWKKRTAETAAVPIDGAKQQQPQQPVPAGKKAVNA